MTGQSVRESVAPLFARVGRSTRVAVEQELFAIDLLSGHSVAPPRVLAAIAGRDYARWITFEPGGQVELSLPLARTPQEAAAVLASVTDAVGADLMARGITLAARPVRGQDPNTPRYLRTSRYDAMERHLDSIGPAGRRMMRATASTQVCLDWWSGPTGLEQWRVLLLAGPFLAAATARATGRCGRLATWLEVDPSRTAFDDRLLHGDDPVTAYADFAAGATDFLGTGAANHLTTLFPPVRPRGSYLEVRFPDARPAAQVGSLIGGIAGLLYDDDRRRSALAVLSGEQDRLAEHWQAAAIGTLDLELGEWLLGAGGRAVAA